MQPPGVCGGGRLRREDTEQEKPKTETLMETMREWSRTKSKKRQACRFPQTFQRPWPVPQPVGTWGLGRWGRGAVLPQAAGSGQGAGAEAGCRAQAGTRPLTLDLQDLVTEVGLEVEGAVGREH